MQREILIQRLNKASISHLIPSPVIHDAYLGMPDLLLFAVPGAQDLNLPEFAAVREAFSEVNTCKDESQGWLASVRRPFCSLLDAL